MTVLEKLRDMLARGDYGLTEIMVGDPLLVELDAVIAAHKEAVEYFKSCGSGRICLCGTDIARGKECGFCKVRRLAKQLGENTDAI